MSEIVLTDASTEEYDFEAVRALASAKEFRRLLRNYSSRLDLFWARPGAQALEGGYWYIVRDNADSGVAPSYWIIQNDDGSYSDPEYRHFERLQAIDSHAHPGLYRDYRKRQDERRRQGRKTEEERHREFREKLSERLEHLYRAQIVVPNSVRDRIEREAKRIRGEDPLPLPDQIDNAVSESGGRASDELRALEPEPPKSTHDRKVAQIKRQIAKQKAKKRRKISGRLA